MPAVATRIPAIIPQTTTISVPSPTGGWNARDSLDAMDPSDAISLVNLFPTFGKVSRRGGYQLYATGLGGPVETLIEYNAAGKRVLLAAANGNIFDASLPGAIGSALATGFTSNRWQGVTFQNAAGIANMVLVNGADAPQEYDGSSIGNATISGTDLTVTTLLGCTVFKDRVFYWQNASQILWYTASGAIAGALTAFNLGGLSGFGGNIQSIATWTRDGGAGPDDYCVILMSSGDVLIYNGTDISDATNWAIVGIFHIGAPIGTRCYAKMGPDVAIINRDGFVPLSQVMPGLWNPQEAVSDKITFAAQQAVNFYGKNFGWSVTLYPLGNMAIFNVPLSGVVAQQYVLNTATGSWAQFTNMNAFSWSLFNDDPYFGDPNGNVCLFNGSTDTGTISSDNGGAITVGAQTAWNYFGDRTRLKRMCLVRPIFMSDQNLALGLAVGVDFNNPNPAIPTTSYSGTGTPWGSPWGSPWSPASTTFRPRLIATGIGNAFSASVAANLLNTSFDWFSLAYQYEPGTGV